MPAELWAATFTSKAAGDWSSSGQTTWNEPGVPGSGDTVTWTHDITVTEDTIVGISPAAGTTVATGITGNLTVSPGVTFVLRGDMVLANSTLILSQGATFKFDSSLSASPATTRYKVQLGNNTGQTPRFVSTGTAATRNTVTSVSTNSAATGYFSAYVAPGNGLLDVQYTDFSRIYDGSTFALTYSGVGAGQVFRVDHCTFDYCGRLDIGVTTNISATGNVIINENTWTNSYASVILRLTAAGATTGSRVFTNNIVDKDIYINGSVEGYIITGNTFLGYCNISSTSGTVNAISNNFFWFTATTPGKQLQFDGLGNISDNYFFMPSGGNRHAIETAPKQTGTINITGNIYENGTSGSTAQAGDLWVNGISIVPVTVNIKNNIVTPEASGTYPSGSIFNIARDARNYTINADNNTYMITQTTGIESSAVLIEHGEAASWGAAGVLGSFKNNLAWGTAPTTGYKLHSLLTGGVLDSGTSSGGNDENHLNATSKTWTVNSFTSDHKVRITGGTGAGQESHIQSNTATQLTVSPAWSTIPDSTSTFKIGIPDMVSSSNADYNCGYNNATGTIYDSSGNAGQEGNGYHNQWQSTGVPGAHDISLNPNFFDKNRNIATWDLSLGGDGTVASALAKIKARNAGYTAENALSFVRTGFRPQSQILKTAGEGGTYIGAVDVISLGSPSALLMVQ